MVSPIDDVVCITDAAKRSHMNRRRAIALAKSANILLDWSLPTAKVRSYRVRWSQWERMLCSLVGDSVERARKAEREKDSAAAGGAKAKKKPNLDPDVTC